jgi:CysZ protein
MLKQPLIGLGYFLKGVKLLTAPGVKRYVAIPLAINFAVFGLLIWLLAGQFSTLLGAWLPTLPDWLGWLNWLLWTVFALTTALVLFFSFSILANIIAAPFNSLLAEAVERHLAGIEPPGGEGFLATLRDAPGAILDEARKLLYSIIWAIPLLIVFWIPVINLAAPILWALFSAWVLALQYVDYPMGNHGIKFKQQRQLLGNQRMLSLGFGGTTLLATMTPILNFLVMPAAVAGATVFWCEKLNQKQQDKS